MDDKKISELEELVNVDDNDYVVVVDRSDQSMSVDGTTKKTLKEKLKGNQGDPATVDVTSTETLPAGQPANVVNVGTLRDAILKFYIPQGDKGDKGDTGAKITSVTFSGNDILFSLDDGSSVTLTNAKIDLKGDKGDTGLTGNTGAPGAVGAKITQAQFSGNDIKFILDDTSEVILTNAKIDLKGPQGIQGIDGPQGIQGVDGPQGIKGDTGAKVISVEFVGDDMKFTLNDGTSVTIVGAKPLLKGDQGIQGPEGPEGPAGPGAGDMLASVYDADGGAKQVAFKDQLHNAVTVTDTAEIDMTLTGQDIKADIKTASIAKSKLDSGVQASLGKADSAIQDISGKEDNLGFTPEDVSNKQTNLTASATKYPTVNAVNTGLATKQNSLGYTAENSANKKTSLADNSDTFYPTQKAVKTAVDAKQDKLVSGTNIKTVNSTSILGPGNINTPNTTYTSSDFDIKDLADSTALKASWTDKQPAGSYEVTTNKKTSLADDSDVFYPSQKAVKTAVDAKMSNPMTAPGDVIYGGASGTPTKLIKGADGQILTLDAGAPIWKDAGGGGITDKTGSYTLIASDAGKTIVFNSWPDSTLTIPADNNVNFPIGTVIGLTQVSGGGLIIAGATNVTIDTKTKTLPYWGALKTMILSGKNHKAYLIKRSAYRWLLSGDIDVRYPGPGPINLIGGDNKAGYFGQVPVSELWTGDELATACGIIEGNSQNSNSPWLRFVIDGKIIYKSQKTYRNSCSWAHLNSKGCVNGTKTLTKNNITYKVRLMGGTLTNPSDNTLITKGTLGSEWNRLMYPISIHAKTNSGWPTNNGSFVERYVDYWGADFSDEDLNTHYNSNGATQLCQEVYGGSANSRVARGGRGVDDYTDMSDTGRYSSIGWSPVLEIIP